MTSDLLHNKKKAEAEGSGSVIGNTRISWSRSKEQVWQDIEKSLNNAPVTHEAKIAGHWLAYSAAAVLAILTAMTLFMLLYTRNITVPSGQHAGIYLPDSSKVDLNAQSSLSYKPLVWKFSRKVKFEGEGYFEVRKGNKFEVASINGKTIVVGTSFNIYSRDKDYKVTCVTGRVKVFNSSGSHEALLMPGQQTFVNSDRNIAVESEADTTQILSWVKNRFSFTSEPLGSVFKEISRQYGVKITVSDDVNGFYTGSFIKDNSVENVLNLVCRPFELDITSHTKNEYVITKTIQKRIE